ncbi:MAG TPA: tetratricopeptide repeat-containing diguanylate cyclase [Thermoanaerobaculia bacterium]|jgi:diguanylate cyclase (GGDEF)-like protein
MNARPILPLLLCIAVTAGAQSLAAQSTSTPSTDRAVLRRGIAHEQAGRLADAARDYAAVVHAATRSGDRVLLGDALTHQAYLQYYRGDINQSLTNARRAYDLQAAAGNAAGRRQALELIAHVYADVSVGQYDRAVEYYRQLLAEFEAAQGGAGIADTQFNLGSTLERKGDLPAALEWYRRALASEEKLGRRGEAAFVRRSIGVTLGKLGRAEEAMPLLDQSLKHFVESKDTERAMVVRQSRGILLRKLGRTAAAVADLEASRRWFASTKNMRFLEKSEDELAGAYANGGRWHDAYDARTRHIALQRELAEKLRVEHTSRLRVQFDAEKKEQENRALMREAAAAARIRRLQTVILILGAAIILTLAFMAVRLVRDARRMRVMAMTDELTRLPNRRHILAAAEEELQRAATSGAPFSLLAFDIDHFKRVNDTYGHAAGDAILQRIAHACRTALRPADRLGRTGGEEFTVLLPSTDQPAALLIAERLRATVESLDCTDIAPSLDITISLGAAQWKPPETLARLAARADAVLYRAKEEGRNRVAA